MSNEREQGKAASELNPKRRGMGSSGENSATAGNEPIVAGGTMGTGESSRQPRPQTHKKSLSLQIEAVRNRKALLRQELELLDSQEQQLVETLQAYEENVGGLM